MTIFFENTITSAQSQRVHAEKLATVISIV